jgi:hypothetical protein
MVFGANHFLVNDLLTRRYSIGNIVSVLALLKTVEKKKNKQYSMTYI